MSSLESLVGRIEDRTAQVGVVGLGYVGLPVAALVADSGFNVTGIDLKADRVAAIASGANPIDGHEPGLEELIGRSVSRGRLRVSTDPDALRAADLVLVCVETPVDEEHRPLYRALEAACGRLGATLQDGRLVIVESTLAPGSMERVVRPAIGTGGRSLHLGHCPERVMPGRLIENLRTMSRVVGGETPEVAAAMAAFYRTYVGGDLDLTDPLTAELVKTAENAYRDVNIAFANQVALICAATGGDVWAVRELVNKSPGRQMLLPGGGVGGHCIPKDPWLLAAAAPETDTGLLRAARALNDSMPAVVASLAAGLLAEAGCEVAGARVTVLGYAYRDDSDDTRLTPSAALVDALEALGCTVTVHDPYVRGMDGDPYASVEGADCAVVMVGHSAYRELDLTNVAGLMRLKLLVDARRTFAPPLLDEAGFGYRVLGAGGRVPAPLGEATPAQRVAGR